MNIISNLTCRHVIEEKKRILMKKASLDSLRKIFGSGHSVEERIKSPRMTFDNRGESTDILRNPEEKNMTREQGEKFQQYLCAVIASIGALIIGSVMAWTSPALKLLSNDEARVPIHLTDMSQSSWVASWTPIGAIIGALPAGYFANQFGRKTTLIGFTIPWIGMWGMLTVAPSVAVLYVARFISGIIVGLFCTILPMYVTEIAEDSIRGTLGTLFQLFLTLGILLDYVLGIFNDYYILNYTCMAITGVFFVLLFFIPESHIYLLKKDQKSAHKVLRRLRGPGYDVDSELHDQRKVNHSETADKVTMANIFSRPNLMALTVAIGLMLCQQFCGINAVIFFAEKIFVMAGAENPAMCTIIVGVVQTVATLVSSILVDRAGRKILLIVSALGMIVCLIALGYFFCVLDSKADISDIKWLPLVSVVGFIVVFSLGLGPLPWMMTGELFSPQIKGFASGIAVAANWICVSLVTFSFQPLLKLISATYTFWMFAMITALASIFIIFVVPETKGKSMQQIQDELAGDRYSSKSVKIESLATTDSSV